MIWGKIIPWILAALLLTILILDLKGCFTPAPPVVVKPSQDSSFYWKNKLGDSILGLRSTIIGFSQITTEQQDSIARLLDTKSKLIQEVITLKAHGQVTLPASPQAPQIVYVDSGKHDIKTISQVFTDPWYQVIASLNLVDYSKSEVQVETFDSLLLAWKVGKSGNIFNRKSWMELDIKNQNPHNHFYYASAYRAPPLPAKKWGLGIFVGWGYGFNVNQGSSYGYPIIGIGLQRNFIRF
jgi:hypothetical protein